MKKTCLSVMLALAVAAPLAGVAERVCRSKDPAVQAKLEQFQDRKVGFFMHFGLYSQTGTVESWPMVDKEANWSRFESPGVKGDDYRRTYFALNRSFNPVRFNAAEWADQIADAGFKYILFTTKHHDGFCLYDSKFTDYKITDPSCPFSTTKKDITKELFDACRARGLGITAYYSKADWHVESYWENHGIGHFTTRHPTYDPLEKPALWNEFRTYVRNQLVELSRDYGPLDMYWLDSGWCNPENKQDLKINEIIAECRRHSPGVLTLGLDDPTGFADVGCEEAKIPKKANTNNVWETCMKMAKYWGYHYDDTYKPVRELVHDIAEVAGKGGNIALAVGPMPNGKLPPPALHQMKKIGDWLKAHGKAIYATRAAAPFFAAPWAFTRSKDGAKLYAIRLWTEDETTLRQAFLPDDPAIGTVKKVVHVKTGKTLPFVRKAGGIEIETKGQVTRDDFADAFELVR